MSEWHDSIRLACEWMIERSLIRSVERPFSNSNHAHADKVSDWCGAFRGEYWSDSQTWDVFCPVWHGGQGVKALVLAYELLGETSYLEAARVAAGFILRQQVTDPADEDCGLLLAYEDTLGVNTSAILESLDGLFMLSRVTGEPRYSEAALAALRWVQRKAYLPNDGLFQDDYDPRRRCFVAAPWMAPCAAPGRPLLDDGVFLAGNASMRSVAIRTADRLLADEDPAGNWKAYPPADSRHGVIHPRHAYWWGRPLWMVHRATGDGRYLEAARRSARWYRGALRRDGGFFRDTGPAFDTPGFGHATSGSACAAILWNDLAREYGDREWDELIQRALGFCRSVQFVNAKDANLRGAILEVVLPPRGRDAPPWQLRDIATFFYVQATCQVLRDRPQLLE